MRPWWNGYHDWLRISCSGFESWRARSGAPARIRVSGRVCGYSLVVEHVLAKDETRVRFSLSAQNTKTLGFFWCFCVYVWNIDENWKAEARVWETIKGWAGVENTYERSELVIRDRFSLSAHFDLVQYKHVVNNFYEFIFNFHLKL